MAVADYDERSGSIRKGPPPHRTRLGAGHPEGLRCGDCRLQPGHPPRSERAHSLRLPRQYLAGEGRVRQGTGRLRPVHPARPYGRRRIANRGSAWLAKGDADKAIADYSEAIRLNPQDLGSYGNRAFALLRKGETEKAIADGNEMIRLDPKNPAGYSDRGLAWLAQGNFGKALEDCREAVRLDPKGSQARWGLAWIQAAAPDARYRNGREAVENAKKAGELFGLSDAFHVAVLAAAYAEAGEFGEAVHWQTKSRDMAPAYQKAAFQSRLDLYKAGKPFRMQVQKRPPALNRLFRDRKDRRSYCRGLSSHGLLKS